MPTVVLSWLLEVPVPELPPAPPDVPSRDNYTDAEVSAAVGKLVQGAIRRPYGVLGERKTLDTFDDTMDAAAGVFILTPNSPFYVLLLGSRRLSNLIESAINTAADLLAAIENTGRRVKPLTNITSLGNARTALAALESASSSRSSAFDEITQAPAFQRFQAHTDRFLKDAAASIRVGTDIAQTPQEARQRLASLVSSITKVTQEVQRRARLLSVGVEDYNSMNLPALLAQGVISRARGVMQERIDQLEPLTPTQRLQHLRDTTLDVLASKAVVKGFGSLPKSGTFIPIEGGAKTFSDATHLATSALVQSELLDPYPVVVGKDVLTFTAEAGDAVLNVPLSKAFIAHLDGTAREPFVFDANTDFLDVDSEGHGDVDVTFTNGSRTAAQVRDQFNAQVTTEEIICETYLLPTRFVGQVNITGTDPNMVFTMIGTGTSFITLGVEVGDGLIVRTGSNYEIYFLVSARTSTTISATRSGPGTAVVQAAQTIEVGAPGRYIRFKVTDAAAEQAVIEQRYIRIDTEDAVEAHTVLGFVKGQTSRCRRVRADELALSINSSPLSSALGVPRVRAVPVFVPSSFQGQTTLKGRTETTNSTVVVSTVFRVRDGVTTNIGPTPARFAVSGAATAGVAVGDTMTIRASPDDGDVGVRGTVTQVTDTEVRANMNAPITLLSGLDLEFGRTVNIARDQVVRILGASPLTGDYRAFGELPNPTEMDIDRPLPIYIAQGGQPVTFEMQIGAFRLDFESLDRSVDSQLEVGGTGAVLFFNAPPALNIGSTRYVLFEKDPKVLGVGDRLELYSGQYQEPEHSFGILSFEQGQKLIEVDGEIPVSWIDLDFSTEITTPFARIRRIARNNYDEFKVLLDLWLALPLQDTQYFRDLNRFLNPLIVNDNPTAAAVNTAKLHVQELAQALNQLQVILSGYEVEPVPRVDTLIESFLSKGSDRAVDTLLEGRFSEFFGYNSEEVSYLGNSLERLREVARLDLPVRRTARKEVVDQQLTMAEFEEPNFEYDQSDTRDTDEPDIPVPFVEIAGGNF